MSRTTGTMKLCTVLCGRTARGQLPVLQAGDRAVEERHVGQEEEGEREPGPPTVLHDFEQKAVRNAASTRQAQRLTDVSPDVVKARDRRRRLPWPASPRGP